MSSARATKEKSCFVADDGLTQMPRSRSNCSHVAFRTSDFLAPDTISNLSASTARFASRRAYAFCLAEPSSSSAAVLVENLRLNQIKNVVLERAGVGSDFDRLELDTSGDPLRMGTRESGTLASSERVDVVPLSSVLERAGGSIDLLKLDCEGAEYDILMKAPAEVLKLITRIVLEYHDPAAIGRQLELAAHLKATGFDVEWWPNAVHPKTLGYMRARRTA